jgi:hypothetical protein
MSPLDKTASELSGSEQYRTFSDDQPSLTKSDNSPKFFGSNTFRIIYIKENIYGTPVELCVFCENFISDRNAQCRKFSAGTYTFIDSRYNIADQTSSIFTNGKFEIRLFDGAYLDGEMRIYKDGIGCMDGNWGDRAASAIIYPETDFFTDAPEMSTVTCSSQGCTLVE